MTPCTFCGTESESYRAVSPTTGSAICVECLKAAVKTLYTVTYADLEIQSWDWIKEQA